MRILHVCPSYFPATKWGGPIESTKAICDGIERFPDFELRVLTTDAASPKWSDRVHKLQFSYPVTYAARLVGHSIAPGALLRLPQAIWWADVVHLTGVYNFLTLPTLAISRLLCKPVVWSPRGALQATATWAAAPRKGLKRRFEQLANAVRPPNTVLHTTSKEEQADSCHQFPDIDTAVIPNCVQIPPAIGRKPNKDVRMIFLGRLHPKKGLDLLFDAMDRLPDYFRLDVYGTGQKQYEVGLASRAARSNGRIRMHGHVEASAKSEAYQNADLFVLPSFSENFGITVAEAMAYELPVLTTTGTPWEQINKRGCGRCVDLNNTNLAAEIQTLANRDLVAMGKAGRAWMQEDFSPSAMQASFIALYSRLSSSQRVEVPA